MKINKSNNELGLLGLLGWQLIFLKGLIIISFIFLPINIPSRHIQENNTPQKKYYLLAINIDIAMGNHGFS